MQYSPRKLISCRELEVRNEVKTACSELSENSTESNEFSRRTFSPHGRFARYKTKYYSDMFIDKKYKLITWSGPKLGHVLCTDIKRRFARGILDEYGYSWYLINIRCCEFGCNNVHLCRYNEFYTTDLVRGDNIAKVMMKTRLMKPNDGIPILLQQKKTSDASEVMSTNQITIQGVNTRVGHRNRQV